MASYRGLVYINLVLATFLGMEDVGGIKVVENDRGDGAYEGVASIDLPVLRDTLNQHGKDVCLIWMGQQDQPGTARLRTHNESLVSFDNITLATIRFIAHELALRSDGPRGSEHRFVPAKKTSLASDVSEGTAFLAEVGQGLKPSGVLSSDEDTWGRNE